MKLTFKGDHLLCEIGDFERKLEASCIVRNEINGWRKLHKPSDVVKAMCEDPYHKPPVMPRVFPKGCWEVFTPLKRRNPYLAPYFIPTSAEQYLDVWSLDPEGGYDKATGEKVLDLGYGLHYSSSNTTVGCIRLHYENDLLWLVNILSEEFEHSHRTWILV